MIIEGLARGEGLTTEVKQDVYGLIKQGHFFWIDFKELL